MTITPQVADEPLSRPYLAAAAEVGDLPAWLAYERELGHSYGLIASTLTARGVTVSYETVRSWTKRLGIL